MMWKEVKTWASSHDYKVERTKIEGLDKKYNYDWYEMSNPNNRGRADSVFNLAKQIYNSITDGVHIDYQNNYSPETKEIEHSNLY